MIITTIKGDRSKPMKVLSSPVVAPENESICEKVVDETKINKITADIFAVSTTETKNDFLFKVP